MKLLYPNPISTETPRAISRIPRGFLRPISGLKQCIDRQLGYFGQRRFVFFYYEPRGEEVVWNDGRKYGFACGGWQAFVDEVVPIARRFGADLGDAARRGRDVLVVDRQTGEVFFTDQNIAQSFVADQAA